MAAPWESFQVVDPPAGGCFFGLLVSIEGEDVELAWARRFGEDPLAVLSLGSVCCLRSEEGLEDVEAVRRPGDEDQCISLDGSTDVSSTDAR
jgi:hypothetical protein